nr:ABC transporter permease [Yoonia sp.]
MSRRPTRMHKARVENILYVFAAFSIVLVAWYFFSVYVIKNPYIMPAPGEVLSGIFRVGKGYLGGNLISHAGASLSVVLIGFTIGACIGVPLGVVMAWYEPMNRILSPVIAVIRPIPPPAWIPLAILWFGIGMGGKVFVIIIAAIVPCILNTFSAVRETPEDLLNAARTMGASDRTLLFEVALPSGLPTILAGLRIALGGAWATVVAAELVAAPAGLGFLILAGYRNFDAPVMAAGMISIAVVGYLMNLGFLQLESRLAPWNHQGGQ